MLILGIETSCDDTSIALYDSDCKKVVGNYIQTQHELHEPFGGINTMIAARAHIQRIYPLWIKTGFGAYNIDLIAYTAYPGMVNSLLVGACFAKSLSLALDVPAIRVNHLKGHILSSWLERDLPQEPYLSLLVSGGHTQLYYVQSCNFTLIGETLDDALGELFDKTARLIGLPYPGGPEIERLALDGKPGRFVLPLTKVKHNSMSFSFSGIKSHIARLWESLDDHSLAIKCDLAYALQENVSRTITTHLAEALEHYPVRLINVVGGVSANKFLRHQISCFAQTFGVEVRYADLRYCTDNGAMIAFAGYHDFIYGLRDKDLSIKVSSKA